MVLVVNHFEVNISSFFFLPGGTTMAFVGAAGIPFASGLGFPFPMTA